MSCVSCMGRTLQFKEASGTKLLGVSSNHNIECIYGSVICALLDDGCLNFIHTWSQARSQTVIGKLINITDFGFQPPKSGFNTVRLLQV